MKIGLGYLLLLIVVIIGVYYIMNDRGSRSDPELDQSTLDPRNSSFKVANMPVSLTNGLSEVELADVPGAKITTRYFGNDIRHDLNNDGREDIAFMITQSSGGTGTFYFVVAVLDTGNGFVGSDSFFIGDRISPQSMSIDEGTTTMGTMRDNVIVVNYAERGPSDPMTTSPSTGKSVWIKLDPDAMQFAEVAQNFEGESN